MIQSPPSAIGAKPRSPASFTILVSITVLAIVILGGMGSIIGAFWGGMTIGLVQQMSTLVVPLRLQGTVVFVVFLLILLIRPQGLFGEKIIDRV